jgi:hypothetical protein
VGNLARKIIEAIQHSMLDRLLLRSIPLWPVGSFWDARHPEYGSAIMTSILFAMLGLFGIAWILGAIANSRPRLPKEASGRSRESHSNGFEAWSEEPIGGLRPPAFLRWIVMRLGSRRDRPEWAFLIEFVGFLSAFVLLWALAKLSDTFWSNLHPALANASVQGSLWIGATVLIVLVVLRQWAAEQRNRLEPPAELRGLPRSEWAPFFMLSVLAVTITAMIGFTFQWPSWSAAVPLIPLAVVGLVPPWRRAFHDVMFGKPVEPVPRRPGALTPP